MSKRRQITIGFLAAMVALAIVLEATLNAFNIRFLQPISPPQTFLFTALSALVFLLLIVALVLLGRNVFKLYADQRSRVLGSRIRTRLLLGALIVSFAPALFMFLFSYGLLNRSIDRWFSQPVAQLREDSVRIALELSSYAAENARSEALSIAASPAIDRDLAQHRYDAVLDVVRKRGITLEGGFALLYCDAHPVVQYQLPPNATQYSVRPWMDESPEPQIAGEKPPLPDLLLAASRRTDQPAVTISGLDYVLGTAATPSGCVALVGLPLPSGLNTTVHDIRSGATNYWTLFRARNRLRSTYLLLMLLLTTLVFFASSWLALHLSKQVTQPVEALADAMDEIGDGHYSHRVTLGATEEFRTLIQSFNAMAADLEASRTLAETSTAQLSEANRALEERRRELEIILETIPNGVVTLDAQLRVLQANRTFSELVLPAGSDGSHPEHSLLSAPIELLFPPELADELRRLVRRSQRMGIAAGELTFPAARGPMHLAVTVAVLELGREGRGYILVLEDVTDFLRAQRQVAWKEVAQRVAHEIKNPLTPISLSAERIRRHVNRPAADSSAVIRKCSDVILGSVETMRALVDQFAALAQFPASSLRPVSLNAVMEAALLPFAGRLEGIRLEQRLSPDLPLIMADPEALKRALSNLIDNAAEAMQDSLHRHLTLATGLNEARTMAEIVVADTGHGLTNDTRERLFLPYFSTKQRGTGLGLAIAATIVQEHQGTIRAEANQPAGARFIIEIPLAESAAGADDTGKPLAEAAER